MHYFLVTPICRSEPGIVLGVARHETVNITCEVESDPPNVHFKWTLNNTIESSDLRDFYSDGRVSILQYTPRAMLGYGVLQCSGSNSIGKMKEPCVFRIVPVGE